MKERKIRGRRPLQLRNQLPKIRNREEKRYQMRRRNRVSLIMRMMNITEKKSRKIDLLFYF